MKNPNSKAIGSLHQSVKFIVLTCMLMISLKSMAIVEYQNTKLQASYNINHTVTTPGCDGTRVLNYSILNSQILTLLPNCNPSNIYPNSSKFAHSSLVLSPTVYQYRNIRNIITFGIDHSLDTVITIGFVLNVNLEIQLIKDNVVTWDYKTLSIDVQNLNSANITSKDKDILVYEDYDDVTVSILDITDVNNVSINTTLPQAFYVSNQIFADKYFLINDIDDLNVGNVQSFIDVTDGFLRVSAATVPVAEGYELEWTWIDDYTFDANGNLQPKSINDINFDFKHNSTRVFINRPNYNIPLVYDRGYIIYRIRALAKVNAGGVVQVSNDLHGRWYAAGSLNDCIPDQGSLDDITNNFYQLVATAHDADKNWQFTQTYAEEGKTADELTYMDGAYKKRQSLTKDYANNQLIGSETGYDHIGRPVVNFMPSPILGLSGTAYEFIPNLNVLEGSGGIPINNNHFEPITAATATTPAFIPCDLPAIILDENDSKGAAKYYSAVNSSGNPFIPKANGYTYAQTKYTNDRSGKVERQSSPGETFALSSDKDTRYLYATPMQIELNRMFGSEVGDASHYKKVATIDANGQTSIAYKDMQDRVIATCITGSTASEGGVRLLNDLPNIPSSSTPLTADLFNYDLNGNSLENKKIPIAQGIEFSKEILVPANADYKFDYKAEIENFVFECPPNTAAPNICIGCVYELTLEIRDRCGELVYPTSNMNSTEIIGSFQAVANDTVYPKNCTDFNANGYNNPTNLFFRRFEAGVNTSSNNTPTSNSAISLNAGVYTVSKRLMINDKARDFYLQTMLDPANNCVQSLEDFVDAATGSIDYSGCHISCTDCIENLGTKADFLSNGGTELQYDYLYEACLAPCKPITLCGALYEQMIIDVSLNGQYGAYDTPSINMHGFDLSVFNVDNKLPKNIAGSPVIGGSLIINHSANFHHPNLFLNGNYYQVYLDDQGNRTRVPLTYNGVVYSPAVVSNNPVYLENNEYYTYPENLLNLQDFQNYWKPDFARSLVVYHPEYCYFEACNKMDSKATIGSLSSAEFDEKMMLSETYSEAEANHFIVTTGSTFAIQLYYDQMSVNNLNIFDPFIYNSQTFNLLTFPAFDAKAMMLDMITHYQGSTLSIMEIAANIVGANHSITPYPFGQAPIPLLGEPDLRAEQWNQFKLLYQSCKQTVAREIMKYHALYECNGYNGCMDNDQFSPFDEPMFDWSLYNNAIPTNNFSIFGIQTNPQPLDYMPAGNPKQPCSCSTYHYYANKKKRFLDPPAQNAAQAEYTLYQTYGICPVALDFQYFLKNMIVNNVQNINTGLAFDITNNSSFTERIKLRFPSYTPTTTDAILFTNGSEFKIGLSNGSASCTINLNNTSLTNFWASGYTITNVSGISNIGFNGSEYTFSVQITYLHNGVSHQVDFDGTTCMDIQNCNFPPNCTNTPFANDIGALLNVLASTHSLVPISSNTFVGTNGNYITSNINAVLNNAGSNIATDYFWINSANTFVLSAVGFGVGFQQIQITFTGASTSFDFNDPNELANIIQFSSIAGLEDGTFTITATIGSSSITLNGIIEVITPSQGTSPIALGTCETPAEFNCTETAHQNFKDLKFYLNDLLHTPLAPVPATFNANIPSLTNGLKGVFGFPFTTQTIAISNTATPFRENATITLNNCEIKLFIRPEAGQSDLFEDAGMYISDMQVFGDADFTDTYTNFILLVQFSNGSTDTIFGQSCVPLKPCIPCNEQVQATQANAQKTKGVYYTFYKKSLENYKEYKKIVEGFNSANHQKADSEYFIPLVSFSDFIGKDYGLSFNYYKDYLSSFKMGIDKVEWLRIESLRNSLIMDDKLKVDYFRYLSASKAVNVLDYEFDSLSLSTPVIKDSTFYRIISSTDTIGAYLGYLDSCQNRGYTPENIAVYYDKQALVSDESYIYAPQEIETLNYEEIKTPSKSRTESEDCEVLYNQIVAYVAHYNSIVPPQYYLDNQYSASTYQEFIPFCECARDYLHYVANLYQDAAHHIFVIPQTLTVFCRIITNDDCEDIYKQYTHLGDSYNDWVLSNGFNYPLFIPVEPDAFVAKFCKCFPKFAPAMQDLISSNNASGLNYGQIAYLIDISHACKEVPCATLSTSIPYVNEPFVDQTNPCEEMLFNAAYQNAVNLYNDYIAQQTANFLQLYNNHCMNSVKESFDMTYPDRETQFTLYYYDQAGNLIKTVPPEGYKHVIFDDPQSPYHYQDCVADRTNHTQTVFTDHGLASNYAYNSLNQLYQQYMPDCDSVSVVDYTQTNGLPANSSIEDIQLKGANNAFAIANSNIIGIPASYNDYIGNVYKSNDKGKTWQLSDKILAEDLLHIQQLSSGEIMAAGKNGTILQGSTNGAWYYWCSPEIINYVKITAVYFISTNEALIGTENGLYDVDITSTNPIPHVLVNSHITGIVDNGGGDYAVSCLENNIPKVYKVAISGGILNTTQMLNFQVQRLNKTQQIDASTVYAAGVDGTLIKRDASNNWTLIKTGITGNILDFYFKDQLKGAAIIDIDNTGKGFIYTTSNGGESWSQAMSNAGRKYTKLHFFDDNINHQLLAIGAGNYLDYVVLGNTNTNLVNKVALSNGTNVKHAAAFKYTDANNADKVFAIYIDDNNLWSYCTDFVPTGNVWSPISWTNPTSPLANINSIWIGGTGAGDNLKGLVHFDNGEVYSFDRTAGTFTFYNTVMTNEIALMCHNKAQVGNDHVLLLKKTATSLITHKLDFGPNPPILNPSAIQTFTIPAAVNYELNSITYLGTNNTTAYTVGNNGQIVSLTATSADETMKIIPHSANALVNCTTASTNFMMLAGDDGAVWRYDNLNMGTTSWYLLNTNTVENISTIAAEDHQYIAGSSAGKLLKTTLNPNGIDAPMQVIFTGNQAINKVKVANVNSTLNAYAGLNNGSLVVMNDFAAPTNTAPITNINLSGHALNDLIITPNNGNVYGAGSVGNLSLFIPNQNAFIFSSLTNNVRFPRIKSLDFSSANDGILLAEKNQVRYTNDGGNNWNVMSFKNLPSSNYNFTKVLSTAANAALVIGNDISNNKAFAAKIDLNNSSFTIFNNAPSNQTFTASDKANTGSEYLFGTLTGDYFKANGNTIQSNSVPVTGTTPSSIIHRIRAVSNGYVAVGDNSKIDYINTVVNPINTHADVLGSPIDYYDIRVLADGTSYICGEQATLKQATINFATPAADWITSVSLSDPWDIINSGNSTNFKILSLDVKNNNHILLGGKESAPPTIESYSMIVHNSNRKFSSRYWYDKLGRLILSQNSKQYSHGTAAGQSFQYSYTLYDPQNRIIEVGQKDDNPVGEPKFVSIFGSFIGDTYNPQAIDPTKFMAWINGTGARTEITNTYYDKVDAGPNCVAQVIQYYPYIYQTNLRGRVSYVTYKDVLNTPFNYCEYDQATYYSYDVHGNVNTLYQQFPLIQSLLDDDYNYIKTTNYKYDLISGKVNQVDYQLGYQDAFSYKYLYDAQNRLTTVYSSSFPKARWYGSTMDPLWDKDATYKYYKHGLLQRTEIGDRQIQAIDQVYTLQGWIKAVNSTRLDIHNDPGSYPMGSNADHPYDVFSYSLGYFNGDYESINSSNSPEVAVFLETPNLNNDFSLQKHNLYNGNITHMVTTIVDPANPDIALPNAQVYQYDQLNRIVTTQAFQNFNVNANQWDIGGSITNSYTNTFAYDLNGNITSQVRYDKNGGQIDDLTYKYAKSNPGTANERLYKNRLYQVEDAIPGTTVPSEYAYNATPFVYGQNINTNNQFSYDANGNLVKDKQAQIQEITWTNSGKIKSIKFDPSALKDNLVFDYDAMGNRIAKKSIDANGIVKINFYSRDAQGNVLAVYEYKDLGNATVSFACKERNLYGSSRLGLLNAEVNCNFIPYWITGNDHGSVDHIRWNRTTGQKQFELSNQLENVLAVVSDYKQPLSDPQGYVGRYQAVVLTAQDYYPFGWTMPGRTFSSEGYRYGFNGKENDKETLTQDYGMRIYDSRIAKFLSVDPLTRSYPFYTPYQFAGNKPVAAVDMDGLEERIVIFNNTNNGKVLTTTIDYKTLTIKTQVSGSYAMYRKITKEEFMSYKKSYFQGFASNEKMFSSGYRKYSLGMSGDNKTGYIGPGKGVLTIGAGTNGIVLSFDPQSPSEQKKSTKAVTSAEWDRGISTMKDYFATWSLFLGGAELGSLAKMTKLQKVSTVTNVAADIDQLAGGSDNISNPTAKAVVKVAEFGVGILGLKCDVDDLKNATDAVTGTTENAVKSVVNTCVDAGGSVGDGCEAYDATCPE